MGYLRTTISCPAGSSLSSWRVTWTFGAGQQVSCSNASWNGSVPSGGSVTFGFNGTWSGSHPAPTVTLG